jgi:hypothetical protein
MYKQRYLIDNAIIDTARAAYLVTLIEKDITQEKNLQIIR